MHLTKHEQSMLDGEEGPIVAEAIDYIIQLGEAFDAEELVDIDFAIYPAEQSIYEGLVEDGVAYAKRGARVKVPTPNTTLACDLERPGITGCPKPLEDLQAKISDAHQEMGISETYTCTPQNIGFKPSIGSYAAMVESSAIIYYNSVLGVRGNRGGLFTRYAAVCGKYPLMGYLLDENRKGTHRFKVNIRDEALNSYDAYSALGLHIGAIVGSEVPVIEGICPQRQEYLVGMGATLATTGSVTLFHMPGVTPEAPTLSAAFQDDVPDESIEVTESDLKAVYDQWTTLSPGEQVDFVTVGCPHYTLDQIRDVAAKLKGKKVADHIRFWVCTNRFTRRLATEEGLVTDIEQAGALVIADTCPVEGHMRSSTCREHGLATPNTKAMVSESGKMTRYVADLIGCKTGIANIDSCVDIALSGHWS